MSWECLGTENPCWCDYCQVEGYKPGMKQSRTNRGKFVNWVFTKTMWDSHHICAKCQVLLNKAAQDIKKDN